MNNQSYSVKKQYLENEKIQTSLRTLFISIVLVVLSAIFFLEKWTLAYSYQELISLPILVLLLNFAYKLFLNHYPFSFQDYRIILSLSLDVLASIYVMYFADYITAYFDAILLWYVIGYSARYGNKVGFIIYGLTILSWSLLIYASPYLRAHLPLAFGWLVAYIVIPLYYFKLIQKLQETIKKLHQQVDHSLYKAGHDPLTNLPNRYLFEETLDKHIQKYQKNGEKFALFFIDLDGFKQINDIYGHDRGDQTLIDIAQTIQAININSARLGGDEFVSIVKYKDKNKLIKYAQTFVSHLQKTYQEKTEILLSASLGIACYPEDTTSKYDLKKYADKAMYKAKLQGKNTYSFYNDFSC